MKPGNTNKQVTQAIQEVADAFDVRPISGTLMHQMKQYVIDGNKMILLREEPEQKVEACTFESGEVYAIDIAMSSGEGRPRETGKFYIFFFILSKIHPVFPRSSHYRLQARCRKEVCFEEQNLSSVFQ